MAATHRRSTPASTNAPRPDGDDGRDAGFPVRNLRFELDPARLRDWHPAGPALTMFFNNLSIFFPAGERFFIRSVRAHAKQVTDPELKAQVRSFCGQEGVHNREHQRYNALLAAQGYPIAEMEARIERLLARVEKTLSPRMCLAATAALEHFTATMGHLLLSEPALLEDAAPAMRDLWRWHAAEENEHKAVAYDVYLAAGGNYPERALAMIIATLIFWAKVIEHQARMMKVDGRGGRPRSWLRFANILVGEPGVLRKLTRPYFEYFKPGFHPWDVDNHALVEAWAAQLAASNGTYGAKA